MNVERLGSRGQGRIDDDEVIDALADRQRREVLRLLREEQGTTLDRLVASLAGEAGSTTPVRDEERRVRTRLRHVDLPKLAETELIEFDASDGRARRRSWRPLVHRVLETADGAPGRQ